MSSSEVVAGTIAEVVARRRGELSPGRQLLAAIERDGLAARVEYDVTITDSLTSSRRKPRHPVRNMLKVVDLSRDPRRCFWYETPARPGESTVRTAELRPETANRFGAAPVPALRPTTAWVQVPGRLWEDPETFESFINYRLIVRLCTAENVTILRGEGGLLSLPGIARLTDAGPLGSTILAACDQVEQNGCTADGLIINPYDYYRLFGAGTLIEDLERNGVFIVRTRLVDPGQALVGDFGHGAQLFDAGRSVIQFAEPPPGTFTEPGGPALRAEIYERVVVNLPGTFFVVTL